mgnify:FL=1
MFTKHTSSIVASSDEHYSLNHKVRFPKKPKLLHPKIQQDEPLSPQPISAAPRKRIYLFSAEWAWSPVNNRLNSYYLSSNSKGWLLWNNYIDDGAVKWSWHWELLAYGGLSRANEKTIASHLLLEFWNWDAEQYLAEHYDRVSYAGVLSVAEVNAIARRVWTNG